MIERWEKISPRERNLIVSGVSIVACLAIFLFLLAPDRKALAQLEAQKDSLARSLVPTPGAPTDAELARLIARRAQLQKSVETHSAALAKLNERFPKDEAAALVAVSDLAARCGVLVREAAPFQQHGDEIARPRRKLTVIATFPALRAFTAGLANLGTAGTARISSLNLDAVSMPELDPGESLYSDPHVLVATIVLVL